MHADVLFVYGGTKGHGLEALQKHVVQALVSVLLLHIVSESEVLSHRSAFVVTSQQNDVFRVV